MPGIKRDSLMSLEQYSRERDAFRSRVLAHKRNRILHLGEHVTLVFEDELTIRYQIQEMLRIERIFEERAIVDELSAYNPLIPDGSNFKATMLIEFPDETERKARLAQLVGIEDRTWLRVAGQPAVHAIADEDLDRDDEVKTSAVHFLRFEMTEVMRKALASGASLSAGINHPHYLASIDPLPGALQASLLGDLSS